MIAFLIVQLSHPYKATGKTIGRIIWAFVSKVMSLLFNMLSSKGLLISWLQSLSAVILEHKKTKSAVAVTVFPLLFAMKGWDQMP